MPVTSTNLALYGTEEVVPPARRLRAGRLEAELSEGNLRHIRFDGVEVIRAVSYIVRDKNWATYSPAISELEVSESPERFEVSYRAEVTEGNTRFAYRARITGTPAGIEFQGVGETPTGFVTNRTGFVVLHPLAGVAGCEATIERVDGSVEQGRFPDLIDPIQPMMDLRAITHEPMPGVQVRCLMEGDTFEMEDQRNWTDASYKTYVRPLALPWPYDLPAGKPFEQKVSLLITAAAGSVAQGVSTPSLTLGRPLGAMPAVGVGITAAELESSLAARAALAALAPHHLLIHYDPRAGNDSKYLQRACALAADIGAEAWLEAVIESVEDFESELRALGQCCEAIGHPFAVVQVSPAADLRGTLPGSVWPPAPPLDALYRAARAAFPKARIGGGMFSFFTELNRKRPPLEAIDQVGFTTAGVVHAGDDETVMENLEALPYVARSARAIAGDRAVVVGPSAIGMRLNPYGAAPMANPGNVRQAMNFNDPRQRGLLGAAWTVGYAAQLAPHGVAAITFGGTTGAHGLVHARQPWPQPWFDEHGGVYPAFHVVRALAALAGKPLLALESSHPARIQGLAVQVQGVVTLLVCNLTPESLQVKLPGRASEVALLDADSFESAARSPESGLDARVHATDTLTLGAYAVGLARLGA